MKKLLNTLYVLSEGSYLSLDGETVIVTASDGSKQAVPLHNLVNIVCFSYKGASPALMGKCRSMNINLSFYSPSGKYLASVADSTNGNVYLRRTQYRTADDESASVGIARNFIIGKLYNEKFVLHRAIRDHGLRIDAEKVSKSISMIDQSLQAAANASEMGTLRGIEGNAASEYYSCFNELILQNKEAFLFEGRNRRPPTDRINALLSLSYSLLSRDCASALYGVGLDPYVGFMHTDRPGRESLALDLVEELRSTYADRFVITLINNRVISPDDFVIRENGAVLLTDGGRRVFFDAWQKKKREIITHPYLEEKVEWGLVPHVQAMLLARFLRGDIDQYPPFLWK